MRFHYEKFREDRSKKYSQQELSVKTGISENTIKNLESGRKQAKYGDTDITKMCEFLELNEGDYWIKDTKILMLYNQKGGCLKSSSCCGLADVMANEFSMKVLIIELDSQSNVTRNLNLHLINNYKEKNIYQAIIKQEDLYENGYIVNTGYNNIDMVLSHLDLAKLDVDLNNMAYRESRIANILQGVLHANLYDIIIFDASPTINMLNTIALRTADYVIVPMLCEAYSLEGLSTTIQTIDNINIENKMSNIKHRTKMLGILFTKYDKRIKLNHAIKCVVEELYDKTFKTVIPTDTSVINAQSNKQLLSTNYKNSNAYKAYVSLTKEVLDAIEKEEK